MLCGIPGSGKSTLAFRLRGYTVSTDSIRKFLWHDESEIRHDKLVFTLADEIIGYMLHKKEDVIFDATNLTYNRRSGLIALAKKYGAKVIVHWVRCPLKTALLRNAQRERIVPEKVIRSLFRSLQTPSLEESIDIIKIYGVELSVREIIISGIALTRKNNGGNTKLTYSRE